MDCTLLNEPVKKFVLSIGDEIWLNLSYIFTMTINDTDVIVANGINQSNEYSFLSFPVKGRIVSINNGTSVSNEIISCTVKLNYIPPAALYIFNTVRDELTEKRFNCINYFNSPTVFTFAFNCFRTYDEVIDSGARKYYSSTSHIPSNAWFISTIYYQYIIEQNVSENKIYN